MNQYPPTNQYSPASRWGPKYVQVPKQQQQQQQPQKIEMTQQTSVQQTQTEKLSVSIGNGGKECARVSRNAEIDVYRARKPNGGMWNNIRIPPLTGDAMKNAETCEEMEDDPRPEEFVNTHYSELMSWYYNSWFLAAVSFCTFIAFVVIIAVDADLNQNNKQPVFINILTDTGFTTETYTQVEVGTAWVLIVAALSNGLSFLFFGGRVVWFDHVWADFRCYRDDTRWCHTTWVFTLTYVVYIFFAGYPSVDGLILGGGLVLALVYIAWMDEAHNSVIEEFNLDLDLWRTKGGVLPAACLFTASLLVIARSAVLHAPIPGYTWGLMAVFTAFFLFFGFLSIHKVLKGTNRGVFIYHVMAFDALLCLLNVAFFLALIIGLKLSE